MALVDAISEIRTGTPNNVFSKKKEISLDFIKVMIPFLLQGNKKVNAISNQYIDNKNKPSSNDKVFSKSVNMMMDGILEGSNQTKILVDELKVHESILKKIELNTRAAMMSQERSQTDLLDVADSVFSKKKRYNNDVKTSSNKSQTFQRLNAQSSQVKKFSPKGFAASGNRLTSAASSIMTNKTVMTGARLGGVGLAASAGMALGGLAYKGMSGTNFGDKIGETVAKTLSFFGNQNATEAVRINGNMKAGASTEKVEVQKVGKVVMPTDNNVKKALEFASKEFNIPLQDLLATAYQESGFNPSAKGNGSSAEGLFQFTTGTWEEIRKNYKVITDKYGIGAANSGDRSDPMKSAIMYGLLRKGNLQYLQKKGVTSGNTMVDSYLAHFLGMGGAAKVLDAFNSGNENDPISKYVTQEAYNAAGNKTLMKDESGQARSVADFLKIIYNKSGARADAYKEVLAKNPTSSLSGTGAIGAVPEPTMNENVTSTNNEKTASSSTNVAAAMPSKSDVKVDSVSGVDSSSQKVNALNTVSRPTSNGQTPMTNTSTPSSSGGMVQNSGVMPMPTNTPVPVSTPSNPSVTATPTKNPLPVRDIPSTIQRILNREFSRAI